MNLFFHIQNLQLLIFCVDGQEFLSNLDYVFLCFLCSFLYRFIILLHLISSFSLTKSLILPYAYVSIESVDCILLSSFKLKAVLLISSVKTLCLSLFNLCCVFNIDWLFLMSSLWFPLMRSVSILFFLDIFLYYQVPLLLNSFYNF